MRVNLWQDLVDWPWVIIVDYFLKEFPLSHHKVCLTNWILVVNGFFSFWTLANAQAQVKNNSRADDSSQNYIFSLGFWRAAGMDWVVEEMVNNEVSFLLYFTHVIWFSCFVWKFHELLEMEEKIWRDGVGSWCACNLSGWVSCYLLPPSQNNIVICLIWLFNLRPVCLHTL